MSTAIAAGEKSRLKAVAIYSPKTKLCWPCGACRQVLIDCEKRYGKDIAVLLFGKKYIYKVKCIRDLMPLAFDEESLV